MEFIELKDYLLLPVYLIIIYIIAATNRNKHYSPKNPVYKYYMPALTVKLIGAIAVGVVYQYYYGDGDTTYYFLNGKIVGQLATENFVDYMKVVFKPISSTLQLRGQINWINPDFGYNESNYFIVRLLGVINLFTFGSYLPSAVIFAFLSFTGIWKAYTSFTHIFPKLYKEFAIAFLFMPSVFFWGSGILKDTVIIGALGWLFYASYLFFVLQKRALYSAVIIFLSVLTIFIVKPYVPLAFLPSLLFWIFFQYRSRIKPDFLKVVALPFVLLAVIIGSFFIITVISAQSDRFEVDTIVNQAATFNANNREAGSSINIGITENMGYGQLIKIAPLAIVTTLFRPFLFEVKNPLMLLSALEGTYVIYLLGLIVFKIGIPGSFKVISQNPLVSFCLVFSLIFAYAIGFSTSNFGTMVRYKIPCIPFFMAALFIILNKGKRTKLMKKA